MTIPLACIFCNIIKKQAPSFPVYEDDNFLVILDIRPVFLGHCLLLPKFHFATLADLPETQAILFFSLMRKLSQAVEEAMQAEGTFIAINNKVSQSVPHLHLHVIPRKKGDGLKGFFWPRQKYEDAQALQSVQTKIQEVMTRLDKS
ncbi:MAG: HIT family protein [Gammaproteobacteria bacterium]|nr:HIT family protein [Gammaproteobacteria bacterium]